MKTIYKYQVPVDDQPHPVPGTVVHVEADGHYALTVWAEVTPTKIGDPSDVDQVRLYRVHGTGHPIPDTEEHRGTVIAGVFVWHLYELVGGEW